MRRFGSIQVRDERHGRRQHRQRVADRRSRPGPDRARRHGSSCARATARARLPLEDFFIAYGKQDRAPGEFVLAIERPRLGEASIIAPSRSRSGSTRTSPPSCSPSGSTSTGGGSRGARIACGGMAATPKRAPAPSARSSARDLDEPGDMGAGARRARPRLHAPVRHARLRRLPPTVAAQRALKGLIEIAGDAAPTRVGSLHAAE